MERVRRFLGIPEVGWPDGAGVRIAVIDSGIDTQHPDLSEGAVEEQFNCMLSVGDDLDWSGHGTHLAGVIAGRGVLNGGRNRGIASAATLLAIKVFRDEEGIPTPAIRRGIDAAIRANADIICLAGTRSPRGSPSQEEANQFPLPPWVWSGSSTIDNSIERAAEQGILCVVAAGNDGGLGNGTINQGAGSTKCLTVGACDADGILRVDSSRGPCYVNPALGWDACERLEPGTASPVVSVKPDLVAIGQDVWAPLSASGRASTSPQEKEAQQALDGYCPMSGTSPATAVVAGLAACALSEMRRLGFHLQHANRCKALLAILREAAAAHPHDNVAGFGYGILRWPAIEHVIKLCKDQRYYEDLCFPVGW